MAISEKDIKILWGRAGGMCSKPNCSEDLTAIVELGNYIIGEMAHVIGRKATARRSNKDGGPDTYDNLILLCPTHHTHIDKAPEGTYPAEMLYDWKRAQEKMIRSMGSTRHFSTFEHLRVEVSRILASNNAIFQAFGPLSPTALADPSSNLFSIWELRRLDRILPNNRKILNLIDANAQLIPSDYTEAVEQFRIHAEAYERNTFHRLDSYPLFPQMFADLFNSR